MKTRTERVWLTLALVAAIAAAAGAQSEQESSQVLTLPNGEKYQFAGVTYGTSPVPPLLAARLIKVLPSSLSNLVQKQFGPRLSQYNAGQKLPFPQYFIWFRSLQTNAPSTFSSTSLTVMLADQAGVIAGAQGHATFSSGVTWSYASFPAVPKRSRVLQCCFYTSGFGSAALSPVSKITIPNPFYGRFPQWQPEPTPAVKEVGDLEVRLDAVVSGHPVAGPLVVKPNGSQGSPHAPIRGGGRIESVFDLSLRSSRGTNAVWALHSGELRDATGNVLHGIWSLPNSEFLSRQALSPSPGWVGYSESFWGALWPDEAAWRLKVELKRAAGFAPAELVTFRSVPLLKAGATNSIFMTNTVGQLQVVLEEYKRWDQGLWKYQNCPKFRLEVLGAPGELAADVIQVTTDSGAQGWTGWGTEIGPGSGTSSLQRFFFLSAPTNATTVDITWAEQKTRTVEFLVKPPKAE